VKKHLLLAAALGCVVAFAVVGCSEESTDDTSASTTTTAVQVTDESGSSSCYIEDIVTQGGSNYIVVDYVVVEQDPQSRAWDPIVTNPDADLRTFLVPDAATLSGLDLVTNLGLMTWDELFSSPDYVDAVGVPMTLDTLRQAMDEGIINSYEDAPAGQLGRWWEIEVQNGEVVSLHEHWTP
jgi:hypothetical protein